MFELGPFFPPKSWKWIDCNWRFEPSINVCHRASLRTVWDWVNVTAQCSSVKPPVYWRSRTYRAKRHIARHSDSGSFVVSTSDACSFVIIRQNITSALPTRPSPGTQPDMWLWDSCSQTQKTVLKDCTMCDVLGHVHHVLSSVCVVSFEVYWGREAAAWNVLVELWRRFDQPLSCLHNPSHPGTRGENLEGHFRPAFPKSWDLYRVRATVM